MDEGKITRKKKIIQIMTTTKKVGHLMRIDDNRRKKMLSDRISKIK